MLRSLVGSEMCIRDSPINMCVSAADGYQAHSPGMNGIINGFGRINVRAGSAAELCFSFLNQSTGKPVSLRDMSLTVYDLDTGKGGNCSESVSAMGFDSYDLLTNASEVSANKVPDVRVTFAATNPRSSTSDPDHPARLTPAQQARSVTQHYKDASEVLLRFAVSPGGSGRNFLFSGVPAFPRKKMSLTLGSNSKRSTPRTSHRSPRTANSDAASLDSAAYVSPRVHCWDSPRSGRTAAPAAGSAWNRDTKARITEKDDILLKYHKARSKSNASASNSPRPKPKPETRKATRASWDPEPRGRRGRRIRQARDPAAGPLTARRTSRSGS
eukprot:TRINITY_DN17562_c0_g1_i3.p1 TRINITY_DN17562_c0_g1~~TRINITY_DN17562_c0_g1_i3.p1  ORF type:complete len:345 (+),score=62.21 TRINITY_DN17562_c0_g1_i3:54-1037(+)